MPDTRHTPTLVEWLTARLDEDEEAARDAAGWDRSGHQRASGRWRRTGISSLEDDERRSVVYSDNNQLSGTVADHIARHDPSRVLADVAAKRRIVERYRWAVDDRAWTRDMELQDQGSDAEETLMDLVSVYRDAPGYRTEWQI